jgi:peptide/nickel transport system permease protein
MALDTAAVDPLVMQLQEAAPGKGMRLLRRARRHRSFVFAALVLLGIVAAALLAPWLAPHDPYAQDLSRRLIPPIFMDGGDWAHPLGTDNLGRDYLSRVLYGARVSLMIGLFAALTSGLIGTLLGVTAGYFGGRIDLLISFILTVRLTLPVVMVSLAVVALIGGSLQVVILVLGLLLWDRFAVVMRSATMQLRSLEFVSAAKALGCSTPRIIFSEILPNLLGSLIVVGTFEMAHAILLEAALSFLGLGVQPPIPSWGLMVSEARQSLLFDPWLIMIPGAAIFVLVLAINLLGDGMRDVFTPEGRS